SEPLWARPLAAEDKFRLTIFESQSGSAYNPGDLLTLEMELVRWLLRHDFSSLRWFAYCSSQPCRPTKNRRRLGLSSRPRADFGRRLRLGKEAKLRKLATKCSWPSRTRWSTTSIRPT